MSKSSVTADETIGAASPPPTLSLSGMPLPTFAAPPCDPMGPAPLRRPGSVRRTMSIDVVWPHGQREAPRFHGHCRDVLTPAAGAAPIILAEDRLVAEITERTLLTLASDPPVPGLQALVGQRVGTPSRTVIAEMLAREHGARRPLYLLLDDLMGASLVAPWAWSRWHADWGRARTIAAHVAMREGICIGFRPGSDALGHGQQDLPRGSTTPVGPLAHPDDPEGWHAMAERADVSFRRARRIDIWRDGETLHVDSAFQDSARRPDGGRDAIHEYRLTAGADADRAILATLSATPGSLPYKECPAALANLDRLVGEPLAGLREHVLVLLRKTAGCTHLNDVLRGLADVPSLATYLAVMGADRA